MKRVIAKLKSSSLFKWIVIPSLFACLILILSLSNISYGKYYYQYKHQDTVNIAIMASDVVIEHSLSNYDLYPGAEILIPVKITNKKNGKISNVKQSYSVHIETLSDIPLQVTFEDLQGNQISPTGTFEAGVEQSQQINIKIIWNSSNNSHNYAYECELIKILVNSSQVGGDV